MLKCQGCNAQILNNLKMRVRLVVVLVLVLLPQ